LGVELPIRITCLDADDLPVWPDSAPQMDVWRNSTGTKVISNYKLFPLDRRNLIGVFWLPLFLTGLVADGYHAIIRYQKASVSLDGVEIRNFEIMPGGNEAGTVISMHYYDRPTGKFLVYQTDGGILFKGKNPQ